MSRIVGILLFTLALSAGAQEYLVSGAAVRLRDKPDPTSKALATVPFGTRVSILTTKAPDPRWVAFWFQGLQGWIAKEYLWPYQPSQRGISYLDLATKQFDASQDSFGNLVELLSFIDSIQFDIPDSRSSKAMEALRVSVLLRSIELATRTGNKEWLSRYTQGRDYASDKTHGVQSPSNPNQTNITTGPNSCVFHGKLDTDSTANWTVIPRQTGH